jgi:SAM-dependent methyltransferase
MDLYLTQYQQLFSWFLTAKGKPYWYSELAALNIQLKLEQGNNLLIIGDEAFSAIKTKFLHCQIQAFANLYKKLPYPDESFDAIVLPHILTYVSQPKLILHEALRLLQPNGILLVSNFKKFGRISSSKLCY